MAVADLTKKDKMLSEFLSLVDVERFEDIYSQDIAGGRYFGMPMEAIINTEKRLRAEDEKCIAYFSMEYGLGSNFYGKFAAKRPVEPNNKMHKHKVFSNFRQADYSYTLDLRDLIDLPIYSGGLGVLAGDTVKTMADYKLPAVGVGMLWNTGYFRQKFWFKYGQLPEKIHWDLYSYPGLIPLKNRVKVLLKNEEIHLRLWKYYIYSYNRDYAVPLILLDSNIEENNKQNRRLTDQLYRSDNAWIRIMQRVILGMGGVAALKGLGYNIDIFHLNEGHAIFTFVEKARGLAGNELEKLKKHFFYTCHTPVQAGHDRFSPGDLSNVIKEEDFKLVQDHGTDKEGLINLTLLSMNLSSVINAVSRGHQKVMHLQFPDHRKAIKYVTNGVHAHTWISDRFKDLFNKYASELGDIKANPMALNKVQRLKGKREFRLDLWQAHQENKAELCNMLHSWKLDKDIFTICWARRIAAYKRPSMILHDTERLIDIAKRIGPIQVIFAGKAHPKDDLGFTYINEMLDRVDGLEKEYDFLKFIMLENYETLLAKILTSSVDVWLNNPLPPFEASGTSGMKAILNGVLQLTTLDGWVPEAAESGIGRFFGYKNEEGVLSGEMDLRIGEDAEQLYDSLTGMVELYYKTNNKGAVDVSSEWIEMMINCISCSGDFNTYRMLDEYKRKIWRRP
ncbi:alpha-glucan family phosphorylase [Candidatus Omnitrophota bacterium]